MISLFPPSYRWVCSGGVSRELSGARLALPHPSTLMLLCCQLPPNPAPCLWEGLVLRRVGSGDVLERACVSRSFGIWTAGCESESACMPERGGLWASVLWRCAGLGVGVCLCARI